MARRSSDKTTQPSAYEKALGLLARREHSARELKNKLARRGFDADENAVALERLQSKDFQSNARFGEMLVRSRIESGYGPALDRRGTANSRHRRGRGRDPYRCG
jgi:regulatory protein